MFNVKTELTQTNTLASIGKVCVIPHCVVFTRVNAGVLILMKNIGAPNSVARFLSEHTFGDNKFIVLERVQGELILRAAQTSLEGARRYMGKPQRELVDVDNFRIIEST